MKITLLHPSRGRAQKALEAKNYWIAHASGQHEIEHILSIDNSDDQKEEYKRLFNDSKIICEDNDCVVQATNRAAEIATGDILIYLSDDFKCPRIWDQLIIDTAFVLLPSAPYLAETPWLLKVDDCLQRFDVAVLTIPIMSRELYKKLSYFWHPGYKSMFVDEDLYWTCKKNGWLIEGPQLKFPHEHCCIGKAERDETYIRSEGNWNQGKAFFAQRRQEGFPLS